MRLLDGVIIGAFSLGEAFFALMIVAQKVEDLPEVSVGRLTAVGYYRRSGVDEHLRFGMTF